MAKYLTIGEVAQRAALDRRMTELASLKHDLDALARHVEHSRAQLVPEQTVAGCDFCPILDVNVEGTRAPDAAGAALLRSI